MNHSSTQSAERKGIVVEKGQGPLLIASFNPVFNNAFSELCMSFNRQKYAELFIFMVKNIRTLNTACYICRPHRRGAHFHLQQCHSVSRLFTFPDHHCKVMCTLENANKTIKTVEKTCCFFFLNDVFLTAVEEAAGLRFYQMTKESDEPLKTLHTQRSLPVSDRRYRSSSFCTKY